MNDTLIGKYSQFINDALTCRYYKVSQIIQYCMIISLTCRFGVWLVESLSSEILQICSSSLSTCKRSNYWNTWQKKKNKAHLPPPPCPLTVGSAGGELTCCRQTGRQVSCSQWRPCFVATCQRGSLSWFGFLSLRLSHLSRCFIDARGGRSAGDRSLNVIGPRCVNNDWPSPGSLAAVGCRRVNIPSLCLLQASIYKPQLENLTCAADSTTSFPK